MNKDGRWLGLTVIISALAYATAAAATDPFLLLSTPTVTNNQVQFTLDGEVDVSYVIEASTNAQDWLAVATNSSPLPQREITLDAPANDTAFYRAWREPLPAITGAIMVRSNITFNGNYITVDSYDSGDTNHSTTNGLYDPLKRKAGGNLCSAAGFIDVGNSTIKGKLYQGQANTGQYHVGTNGSVGDLNWTGPGIQPGWYLNNFSRSFLDVAPPYSTGLPPTPSGTNFWYLVGGFNYYVTGNVSANSSSTIYVAGNANVFVAGSFSSAGKIIIAPGASLRLYVGGGTTSLGQILSDGKPTSFHYYGLASNTDIAWTLSQSNAASFYAPNAKLTLSAGGASTNQLSGACVLNSITVNGALRFHFDENLMRGGPTR